MVSRIRWNLVIVALSVMLPVSQVNAQSDETLERCPRVIGDLQTGQFRKAKRNFSCFKNVRAAKRAGFTVSGPTVVSTPDPQATPDPNSAAELPDGFSRVSHSGHGSFTTPPFTVRSSPLNVRVRYFGTGQLAVRIYNERLEVIHRDSLLGGQGPFEHAADITIDRVHYGDLTIQIVASEPNGNWIIDTEYQR